MLILESVNIKFDINLLSFSSSIEICAVCGFSSTFGALGPTVTAVNCPENSSRNSTMLSSKIVMLRSILRTEGLKVRSIVRDL